MELGQFLVCRVETWNYCTNQTWGWLGACVKLNISEATHLSIPSKSFPVGYRVLVPWNGLPESEKLLEEFHVCGEVRSCRAKRGKKRVILTLKKRVYWIFHTGHPEIRPSSSFHPPSCPHWAHLKRKWILPIEKGQTAMKNNFKDISVYKVFELHHWQWFTSLFSTYSCAEQTLREVWQ